MSFNQNKYNNEYKKDNYARITCEAKKTDIAAIKQHCTDFNISVSQFIQLCCKYCIDNVHIDELKRYK